MFAGDRLAQVVSCPWIMRDSGGSLDQNHWQGDLGLPAGRQDNTGGGTYAYSDLLEKKSNQRWIQVMSYRIKYNQIEKLYVIPVMRNLQVTAGTITVKCQNISHGKGKELLNVVVVVSKIVNLPLSHDPFNFALNGQAKSNCWIKSLFPN